MTETHASTHLQRTDKHAWLRVWRWPIGAQAAGLMVVLIIGLSGSVTLGHRTWLLPGKTSHGHHLVEPACSSCHGGFAAPTNERCTSCHREELAHDTHPSSTFDDPRWSAELASFDTRRCTTCHAEHRAGERLSVSREVCATCHDDVPEKRASHRGFAPSSCMDAGCHNYHDNGALDPSFLRKHLGAPATFARTPALALPHEGDAQVSEVREQLPSLERIRAQWQASVHARTDVGCERCHGSGVRYVARPSERACAECHDFEVQTFERGKHGVRLAVGLPALRAADARLPMRHSTASPELGCGSCHDVHALDITRAAVEGCLGCHSDQHSLNFRHSAHAANHVTCATCHLPRVEIPTREGGTRVAVVHNNSLTYSPVDRMARMVCLNCHNLELTLSALADPTSIERNFAGAPAEQHRSISLLRATAP